MPEIRGRFSDAAYGDTLQWIGAALARVEARQEVMERTLSALTAQLADLDAVLRRAAAEREPVPPRRTRVRGRRADTVLKLVQAMVIAAVCLAAVAAGTMPRHWRELRDSPRCAVTCARPLARVDFDHDGDAR